MAGYPTDLYVSSQTAHQMVVVVPPVNSNSFGWIWIVSLLCLAVGYGVLSSLWKKVEQPVQPALRLTWLIPIVIAVPFVVLGVIGQVKTQIILSADNGTVNVQRTLFSFSISAKEYPFSEVRDIRVGISDVSRFLYVSLTDKPAEDLTGATSQTGFNEVAEAMNGFLDMNRKRVGLQSPVARR